jgi:hypothetical protein
MSPPTGETLSPLLEYDPNKTRPPRAWRWWLSIGALVCGVLLLACSTWAIVTRDKRVVSYLGVRRLLIVGWAVGLLLLGAIPLIHRLILAVVGRLRRVTPRGRQATTVAIFFLAIGYLLLTPWLQGRDLTMNIQDEMMYLVQAQMLAHGHLYMPAHPMADFFQELFIFHKPVYASMYFPGTALLYAPSIWLHVPNWLVAVLVSASAVAMTYRVLAELVDGLAGVLGAMLLVACGTFRWTSVMVMSHPLALLLGLLMFWSYLHWRRNRRAAWMVAFGLLAGWAAITRPIDAIAWCLPPFTLILVDLWNNARGALFRSLLLMGVAAAPFISLQLVVDKGVTGHWLLTPVQAYHDRYFPATFEGPGAASSATSLTPRLPQFEHYNQEFIIPGARQFQNEQLIRRVPFGIVHTLPATWLIVFVPLGIVGLRGRGQWGLAAVLALFTIGYMTFMFFAAHYLVVVIPAGLLLVVVGLKQLERLAGDGRLRSYITVFCTLVIVATSAACLPEGAAHPDEPRVSLPMHAFNHQVPQMDKPAVVFFHSQPDNKSAWRHEQVFNIDAAWPDDSPVVRAQDLGDRDIELVRYYAQKQPNRVFYRFELESRTLTRLGTATELRDHPERIRATDTSTTKPAAPAEDAD